MWPGAPCATGWPRWSRVGAGWPRVCWCGHVLEVQLPGAGVGSGWGGPRHLPGQPEHVDRDPFMLSRWRENLNKAPTGTSDLRVLADPKILRVLAIPTPDPNPRSLRHLSSSLLCVVQKLFKQLPSFFRRNCSMYSCIFSIIHGRV